MAQRHGGNRGNRGGNEGAPRSLDMVVDTAIINTMDLEPEIVTKVLELQSKKAEELKAKIIEMASQAQANQGQGFDPKAIAAMREQMDEFKFEYRMAFRKIIGVDNYITYLEKVIDKRPAMGAGPGAGAGQGMRRGGGNFGGGFGGGQGNWGGQGGNFGGGFGGEQGGGFGGDDNNF